MNPGIFFLLFPQDSGPIYQETLAGRLPVEPFNTYSNIFFLLIIIHFSVKVYSDYKNHRFLARSLPVLFLGFVGGTVYHATRSHDVWMYMDWLPIVILCLAVSIYYSTKLKTSRIYRSLLILLILFLVLGVQLLPLSQHLNTSIGYIVTAVGLLLPIFLYFFTVKSNYWEFVVFAIISFGFAISFRILDNFVYLIPMGTHWLWHCFGALSVYFLMNYIYKEKRTSLKVSAEMEKTE